MAWVRSLWLIVSRRRAVDTACAICNARSPIQLGCGGYQRPRQRSRHRDRAHCGQHHGRETGSNQLAPVRSSGEGRLVWGVCEELLADLVACRSRSLADGEPRVAQVSIVVPTTSCARKRHPDLPVRPQADRDNHSQSRKVCAHREITAAARAYKYSSPQGRTLAIHQRG